MYPRWVRPLIERALLDTPAVFVAGPRQSGKSTLVRLIRQDGYVTLDRATVRAGAGVDPDGFVAGLPVPVALDEVQRVPDLLLAVKAEIDEHRQPGRFLLTGSANVLMLPKVADALPGRMEIVELWPLSQSEIDNRPESFIDAVFEAVLPPVVVTRVSRGELFDRVLCGGFPESLQRPADRRSDWFESYLTAVVEREVRDLSNVGSVAELTVMIRLIAARAGSLFNLADVARGAQLPHSTARNYLGLLRAVFLVVDVPAWTTSLTTRIVRAPKLFLVDSGLTAHLLGIGRERLTTEPHLAGGLFEAFVAMELRKQISWSRIRPGLAHFRTKSGDEVDLVMEARDGTVVGVEVKSSATVRSGDFAGLRVLAEIAGHRFRRGVVLYTGTDVVSFGPKLVAAPVSLLWS
ncbi:MAG TPA: ATP-binding protein [Pseudonocardiaceae bacterium]|nr:ATP-binding protein [Pseudonocardiaceae bacterium]